MGKSRALRPGRRWLRWWRNSCKTFRLAQNLIVLKTSPGHANSVAVALDDDEWPEVVGTLAGDDTILVIAPDNATAQAVRTKFLAFLERPR